MTIEEVASINTANRLVELDRRTRIAKGPEGDFDGTVTGYWVRIDQNGGGVVDYNGKRYVTKPLGWTGIRPGTPVKLTSASGIYYSNW